VDQELINKKISNVTEALAHNQKNLTSDEAKVFLDAMGVDLAARLAAFVEPVERVRPEPPVEVSDGVVGTPDGTHFAEASEEVAAEETDVSPGG